MQGVGFFCVFFLLIVFYVLDPLAPDRYHCSHAAGVHTVVLPWIQEYNKFFSESKSSF